MNEQTGDRPGLRPGDAWIPVGEGEFLLTGREWAADVLDKIAYATAAGAWPDEVTIADVARALRRAISNVERLPVPGPGPLTESDDSALAEFVRGWRDAQTCGDCPWGTGGAGTWPIPDDAHCHHGLAACARVRSGPSTAPST